MGNFKNRKITSTQQQVLATVAITNFPINGRVEKGVHVISKTSTTAQVVIKFSSGNVTRHLHRQHGKWVGQSPLVDFNWKVPNPLVVEFIGGGL